MALTAGPLPVIIRPSHVLMISPFIVLRAGRCSMTILFPMED